VPLERSQLYICTGRQQQERCRGYGPSRRSVGRESCKMTRTLQAVFEKCLRDRNSPIYVLSQNGYGDRRVKARRWTCCVPLDKIIGAGEHRLSAKQDATLPYTVWPSATKMSTSLTMLSLFRPWPPNIWQSRHNHNCTS
jgi:hypothetical protein